ncbi:hypothetical protein NFI96_008288, partial [Prochilodus magdalenae]
MAGTIYEVIGTEELNRGERVEMVGRGQEPSTKTQQTQHPGSRCCGPAAGCLGLLCVLLLAAITVLWIKFTIERDQLQTNYTNLTVERDQLQTSYNNLTIEKDQLQTSYTNLTKERDQLQTSYTSLAKERDQLQTSYTNLTTEKDQLQTSYTNLAKERDQSQKERDEFKKQFSELETHINQLGWRYFNSSLYYISNETKSWEESKQDCIKRGADLVIINSREEQDFIETVRGDRTAWIGLICRLTKGGWSWKWLDNSTVDTGFWSRGQPYVHGHCAITGYGSDPVLNWYNFNCYDLQYWICEKRVIELTASYRLIHYPDFYQSRIRRMEYIYVNMGYVPDDDENLYGNVTKGKIDTRETRSYQTNTAAANPRKNTQVQNETPLYGNAKTSGISTADPQDTGTSPAGSRAYKVAAGCLGLMCVLLLAVITVLWLQFTAQIDLLQTSYNNLTIERDQLQTSYTNLTIERDQLQTSYTNLTKLKYYLETSYISVVNERDELQRRCSCFC